MRSKLNYLLGITLSIFLSPILQAQVWSPLGNGISHYPDPDSHSSIDGNNYYFNVGFSSFMPIQGNPTIYKWNGLAWSTLLGPSAMNPFFVKDMEVLNNKIYMVIWENPSTDLYEFDGNVWTKINPPGFTGQVERLIKHNGSLYLAGNFTASGGIDRIAKYDPASGYSSLPNLPAGINSVGEMISFGGNLYISDTIGQVSSIRQLSGSTWTQPFTTVSGTPPVASDHGFTFVTHNGNLLCFVTFGNKLYSLSGSTMSYVTNLPFSGVPKTPFGNLGATSFTSDRVNNFYSFNGSSFSLITPNPYGITTLDEYAGGLIVMTQDTIFNQIRNMFSFFFRTGSSVIKGDTYHDQNGDCSRNSGEPLIHPVGISLTSGNSIVGISNNRGQYNTNVPPGTYNLTVSPNFAPEYKNMVVNCTLPTSITVGANQTITQDIPLSNSIANDLVITLTSIRGFRARHGDTVHYEVKVSNAGTSAQSNVPFTVTLPSTVTLQTANPTPSSQGSNVLNYTIGSIQPYQSLVFNFSVRIEPTLNQINDYLTFVGDISTFTADSDPADNVDTLQQRVVGAYDPNDKQASDYSILPQTNNIDYHIRFQNTGNDTAYKVIVVDTLDLNLPLTSVRINSASHPYSLSVVNNVLIWEFDKIMLPDSTTDLAGSQGYVNFSTRITPGLQVGDSIRNRADIFFDFQAPIKTNYAVTSIVQSLGTLEPGKILSNLRIYPNPASDKLFIETSSGSKETFSLFNIQGQKMQEVMVPQKGRVSLDVNQLAKGVYLLTNGLETHKIIIE